MLKMFKISKIFKKAGRFPREPGAYFFTDKNGKILYVGRAVNLRRRILNYFQKSLEPRIKEMVEAAEDAKFRKTVNLLEAVVLEANLIKKHWPKYNVRGKDDRSFIYIVILQKGDFPAPKIIRGKELEKFLNKNLFPLNPLRSPRICLMANPLACPRRAVVVAPLRGAENDGPCPLGCGGFGENKFLFKNSYIFGPYQSLSLVKNALKIIRRIFPYSVCAPNSGKPCFYYQIGLCPGVCVGKISKKDYQKNVKNLILFLKGEKRKLLKKLQKENPDKIKALRHIQDAALLGADLPSAANGKQQFNRIEGYDISHLSGKETYGSMAVFIGGEPDKSEYRLFKIKKASAGDDLAALTEMIKRRFNHQEWQKPDLILIDGGKPQVDCVSKILKKINVGIPLVGVSKYGGDKLVLKADSKKSFIDSIKNSKGVLLKLRDEAHKFALKAGRKERGLPH